MATPRQPRAALGQCQHDVERSLCSWDAASALPLHHPQPPPSINPSSSPSSCQVGNARGRAKPDPVQCFQLLQKLAVTLDRSSRPEVQEYQRRCEEAVVDVLLKGAPPPVSGATVWGWGEGRATGRDEAALTGSPGAATTPLPLSFLLMHLRCARQPAPSPSDDAISPTPCNQPNQPAALSPSPSQVRRLICQVLAKLYLHGDQLPLYSRVSSLQLFLGTREAFRCLGWRAVCMHVVNGVCVRVCVRVRACTRACVSVTQVRCGHLPRALRVCRHPPGLLGSPAKRCPALPALAAALSHTRGRNCPPLPPPAPHIRYPHLTNRPLQQGHVRGRLPRGVRVYGAPLLHTRPLHTYSPAPCNSRYCMQQGHG